MSVSSKWCPVANTYLVSGIRQGENFEEEITCESSRKAYITIQGEEVQVIAIKMKSPFTQKFTILVPSEMYLRD